MAGVVLALGVPILFVHFVPLPQTWLHRLQDESLIITDRHGEILYEPSLAGGTRARAVRLQDLPDHLLNLLLFTEDRRFYRHPGIDPIAIGRAVRSNWRAGHTVQGASTITQQLARQISPGPRRLKQKIKETLVAFWLEGQLSKQQILEFYLNRAPFGPRLQGIAAASLRYFNKSPHMLSLKESAFLISLLKAPSRYDPRRHYGRALQRTHLLLAHYAEHHDWSGERRSRVQAEQLAIHPWREAYHAPHFIGFVSEQMGPTPPSLIRTTLDLSLQRRVEHIVADELSRLSQFNVGNAAVLVIDPQRGDILAWLGSADFWDDRIEGMVDGVGAFRQPGSALKPFTYGLALESGWGPHDVIPDIPTRYWTDGGAYQPENYNHRYHGPVSFRMALGSSLNVPAVRVTQDIGVEKLYHHLSALGFSRLTQGPAHYGLGLTLGNAEVSLFELVRAYSVWVNGGRPCELHGVFRPHTKPDPHEPFYSIQTQFLIRDILTDARARLLAFGHEGPLNFDYPVMTKTGTSTDYRDNWALGVTPEYVVGVWVGNFDGQPLDGVSGVTGAAPIMHRVIEAALDGHLPQWAALPPQLSRTTVCTLSGMLASHSCPHRREEWTLSGQLPLRTCDWHHEDGEYWPIVYSEWLEKIGRYELAERARSRVQGGYRIITPRHGDVYRVQSHIPRAYQSIQLRSTAPSPVQWYLNGQPVASGPSVTWTLARGQHRLEMVAPDGRDEVRFRVE